MPQFHNRTRTSTSIPARLRAEGRWFLVPLYYLLLSSDLGREGIENSGSYRFADHVYANRPTGRFLIGALLDAILLRLKSARSLRARYVLVKREIELFLASRLHDQGGEILILSVPCGLARELFECARELERQSDPIRHRVRWTGMDLDPDLVGSLQRKALHLDSRMSFCVGDALAAGDHWGPGRCDMIVSIGFTEFLDDQQTLALYGLALEHLKPGGVFVTSGMKRHRFSDYLLRNIGEIHTHYRSEPELKSLAAQAGFGQIRTHVVELQTMLLAQKVRTDEKSGAS